MASETLIPEGLVNEYLGVKRAPKALDVNISMLNALGDRWLNRADILKWLELHVQTTGSDLVERLRRELAEVTQGKD